jgi:hypothetical protein
VQFVDLDRHDGPAVEPLDLSFGCAPRCKSSSAGRHPMRTTVFVALLLVSMLSAGTTAAQRIPSDEIDVTAIKPVSAVGPSSKHTSRPHISKRTTKEASADASSGHTSRAHNSESANENAIKPVSIDGSSSALGRRISVPTEPQPRIPLPEPELLERQAAPDCEFKSSAPVDDKIAFRAMKLDYEQQCYRQSESILRARMERLQDAVNKTIESLKRSDRISAQ